jgi:hypothetical protein
VSTAIDNCAATPTGGDPSTVGDDITGGTYWTSWTFDAVGNRLTQTWHTVTTSGYYHLRPLLLDQPRLDHHPQGELPAPPTAMSAE